jgi:ribulose-phosphate 3-epimerase
MRMVVISASLMCASQLHLYRDVHSLLKAGIDMFHFDIMDGEFVENIALNIDLIKELRAITHKKFDAHLMVKKPSKYITRLHDAGVNIIYFHIEAEEDPHYVIGLIRQLDMEAGLVINPDTPLENLYPYMSQVSYLMFMTVTPGWAGQPFQPSVLQKIEQFQIWAKEKNVSVQLVGDGNINLENLERLREKGVEIFVGGTSGLFTKDGFLGNLEMLKKNAIDQP